MQQYKMQRRLRKEWMQSSWTVGWFLLILRDLENQDGLSIKIISLSLLPLDPVSLLTKPLAGVNEQEKKSQTLLHYFFFVPNERKNSFFKFILDLNLCFFETIRSCNRLTKPEKTKPFCFHCTIRQNSLLVSLSLGLKELDFFQTQVQKGQPIKICSFVNSSFGDCCSQERCILVIIRTSPPSSFHISLHRRSLVSLIIH